MFSAVMPEHTVGSEHTSVPTSGVYFEDVVP